MITARELNAAKRNHYGSTPIEQLPYFVIGQNAPGRWILRDGKWQPRKRKPQSEETKAKISISMKRRWAISKESNQVSPQESVPSLPMQK